MILYSFLPEKHENQNINTTPNPRLRPEEVAPAGQLILSLGIHHSSFSIQYSVSPHPLFPLPYRPR